MNTIEINKILSNHLGNSFLGVYPRDGLPHTSCSAFSFVSNTDPSTKEGEHWIAVYVDEWGRGIYYDSFGFPPIHEEFSHFMKQHCSEWTWNDTMVQNPASTACGHHCIFYLMLRHHGYGHARIVTQILSDDVDHNDSTVIRFVNAL